MLLLPFCVLRNGERIEAVPLRHNVSTGIEANDVRLDLGMISEYEEREASVFNMTPWHLWLDTDTRERAASVAHMRYHRLINAHSSEAVRADSELKAKKGAKKNG